MSHDETDGIGCASGGSMQRRNGKSYLSLVSGRQSAEVSHPQKALGNDSTKILAAIASLREELITNAHQSNQVPNQPDVPDVSEVEPRFDNSDALKSQLTDLSDAILETKKELAHLSDPTRAAEGEVKAATLELDAVVGATEAATNDIMSAAEMIDDLASRLKSQASSHNEATLAEEINEKVVNIFEACNFQDITGQRITKVVNTLNFIDERVSKMMELWGAERQEGSQPESDGDSGLLNGPSLDGDGANQDDIDALFD
jgi:chemotaxis protein CheZ